MLYQFFIGGVEQQLCHVNNPRTCPDIYSKRAHLYNQAGPRLPDRSLLGGSCRVYSGKQLYKNMLAHFLFYYQWPSQMLQLLLHHNHRTFAAALPHTNLLNQFETYSHIPRIQHLFPV